MPMHPQARQHIRRARVSSGLSLRELGRRTGVTASLLSQIETGKSAPSFSTLTALVAELGLSLDALVCPDGGRPAGGGLEGGRPEGGGPEGGRLDGSDPEGGRLNGDGVGGPPGGDGGGGGADGPDPGNGSPVVRSGERTTLYLDSGIGWERLTRGPSQLLDAHLVTYQPGATSSSDGKTMRHKGFEYAYLISGELVLTLGEHAHVLRAGDSLHFDASVEHVYRNASGSPAQGLWFVLGRDGTLPDADPRHLSGLARSGAHDPPSVVGLLRLVQP